MLKKTKEKMYVYKKFVEW